MTDNPHDTLPPDDDRRLINKYLAGHETAARELFDKYCERLMTLARKRIGNRMNSRLDPEDVIQSAFRTFFVHVRNEEFKFTASDDLFKQKPNTPNTKTLRQIAYHRAAKRNPAMEEGHSDSAHERLMQVMDSEPTPEAEVTLIEEFEKFLAKLNPFERQVLELKLQGHSTAEIAEQLGSYERKIRRVIERVRDEAESNIEPVAEN